MPATRAGSQADENGETPVCLAAACAKAKPVSMAEAVARLARLVEEPEAAGAAAAARSVGGSVDARLTNGIAGAAILCIGTVVAGMVVAGMVGMVVAGIVAWRIRPRSY